MADRLATLIGGSGFLGRHVAARLAANGWRVRVAVRRPEKALFLKPMGDVGQIEPVQCNVRNANSVAAALRGASAVINLVGILYETGRQRFTDVHVEGAATVARAATEAGVERLVQVSAIGADPDSASLYARTKAAGEVRVRDAFPSATLVRPSLLFGPDDGFFNLFAGLARLSPVLPLIGGGTTRFQPVYVADAAAGIVALLDQAGAGKTYEFGGPTVYTFRELMELVLRTTGRRRLLVPVPVGLAKFEAWFLQMLPKPLLTVDQVKLLMSDNVVAPRAAGLADLGIAPTAAEVILPTYLGRFRDTGQFAVPAN